VREAHEQNEAKPQPILQNSAKRILQNALGYLTSRPDKNEVFGWAGCSEAADTRCSAMSRSDETDIGEPERIRQRAKRFCRTSGIKEVFGA